MGEERVVKVGFLGDTSFTGVFRLKRDQHETVDPYVIEKLQECDEVVVNLEGPLTESPCIKNAGICLSSSSDSTNTLKALHTTIVNLANNHTMDSGIDGLADTIKLLEENEFKHFGAGLTLEDSSQLVFIEKDDIAISLIATSHIEGDISKKSSPGVFCAEKNYSVLKSLVSTAKKKSDWVVLNYHGGEEFTHLPMPRRRKLLKRYLDLGIDLIICHHPHVVQGYEMFGDKAVFYSLGNFIFDIESHHKFQGTDESVVVIISFSKFSFSFEVLFTRIDLKRGTVEKAPNNNFFVPLVPENYKQNWEKECFRLLFSKSYVTHKSNSKSIGKSNSILRKLFRLSTYRSLFLTLKARNTRPIVFAAYKSLLRQKIVQKHTRT